MRQRSVMNHQFSQVPQANIQRSSFDRSHGYKTTLDAGYLVPIFLDEAVPGDTFNLNMTGFARLATPIKPIMDNIRMETFFFSVPARLLWDNWKRMMGEQDNPGDSVDYEVPRITAGAGALGEQGLFDYLGLPVHASGTIEFNALPARAYNLIWNEWFRDQNLQDSVPVNKGDGQDDLADYALLRRGKRHDYFTSCLPWPQKGEDVTLPTLESAPVVPDGNSPFLVKSQGGGTSFNLAIGLGQDADDITGSSAEPAGGLIWTNPRLTADLSAATTVTINDLRVAFQFQKMLERDARSGTRYTEVIRAHFGVTSPDARQQRPEFLGGGSSMVNISPVPQTVDKIDAGGAGTVQGNLAAYGTATLHGHGFTHSFTEHCYVIGLLNVRADLTYQQGINRLFLRQQKYDFYWPSLAHVGEQAVFDAEIFTKSVGPVEATILPYPEPQAADGIFGYQERYAEMRYKPSMITGRFRSDSAASLDVWHLSQDFADTPLLNGDFIQDDPPIDRVIAVQDETHFLFDAYFKYRCARPMPLYGVPGNIDRF